MEGKSMRSRVSAVTLFLVATAHCLAQNGPNQINPNTQIRWPQVTGAGAPTPPTFPCASLQAGTPYTDLLNRTYYVCAGAAGWIAVGTIGGSPNTFPTNAVVFGTGPATSRAATEVDLTGAFTDNQRNFLANGISLTGSILSGWTDSVFMGNNAGAKWGTVAKAGYAQTGMIAIGSHACENMLYDNGSVCIGYGAMQNTVGGIQSQGFEDKNAVAIGPFAAQNEDGSGFEFISIGNKNYQFGKSVGCEIMIGNHMYAPTGPTGISAGNCGVSSDVWVGGSITGAFLNTNSFVMGNHSVFLGGDIFNFGPLGALTGIAPNTTYSAIRETIIGGATAPCFFNAADNTIIGYGVGPSNCTTPFNGSQNIYITGGRPGAGNALAPNWAGGTSNVVLTGQGFASPNAVGGNLTNGSANVLIGGGAGAAIANSNFMVAIGDNSCKSATFAGSSFDVCLGAESDIQASVNSATAIGANAKANANGAVQIGSGTNAKANSLQFQNQNFLDNQGNATFAGNETVGGGFSAGGDIGAGGNLAGSNVSALGITAAGLLAAGQLSNYVGYSYQLSHTGWALALGTVTVTENSSDIPPPFPGTQVNKIVFGTASAQWRYVNAGFPTVSGTAYSSCAWIYGASGGEPISIGVNQNASAVKVINGWTYSCAKNTSTGTQLNTTWLITSSTPATVYVAGASTVIYPNSTIYLSLASGTPQTTPAGIVQFPFLNDGPLSITGGKLATGGTVPFVQNVIITTGICTATGASYNICTNTTATNWPITFGDTNYSVNCTGITPGNGSGPSGSIAGNVYNVAKTATGITPSLQTLTSSGFSYAEIDCIGKHI